MDKASNKGIYPATHLVVLFLLVASILAFWPVYFSKLSEIRITLHLHTVLALSWVILLIVQSWLASKKNFGRHKKVGKLSYIVIPLFVFFSLLIFHDFLNSESTFSQQLGARITFYDLTGMLYFTTAYLLAVSIYKKNIQIHARLMISTIIVMLFPIIGRLFLFYADFGLSPAQILVLTIFIVDFIVLTLVYLDWRRGRIYPVFPVLFAVTIFQHIGYMYSDNWPAWIRFVDWYAAL